MDCSICFEVPKSPLSLNCDHVFCRTCIHTWIVKNLNKNPGPNCPYCRTPISGLPIRYAKLWGQMTNQLHRVEFNFYPLNVLDDIERLIILAFFAYNDSSYFTDSVFKRICDHFRLNNHVILQKLQENKYTDFRLVHEKESDKIHVFVY